MSKKKLLLIVLAVALVAGVVVFATSGEGLQGRMFTVKKLVPKVGNLCTDTGTPDLAAYMSIVRTANYDPVMYKAQLWIANTSNVNVVNQSLDTAYSWGSSGGTHVGEGEDVKVSLPIDPLNIPCKKRVLAKTLEISVPNDNVGFYIDFEVDSPTNKLFESNEDNNYTSKYIVVNTVDYRPSIKSYVNENGGNIMPGFEWSDLSVSPLKKYTHYFYTGEPPHTFEPTWSNKLYSAPYTMEPNRVAYYTADSDAYISNLSQWNVLSGCDQKTGKCQGNVYVGQGQTLYFMLEYKHKDGTLTRSNVFKVGPDNESTVPTNLITRCQLLDSLHKYGFLSLYSSEAATFADVPKGHQCFPLVEGANKENVLNGYADGTFGPDKNIMRAEVSKAVSKAADLDPANDGMSPFGDVAGEDWYYPYVMALYFEGVFASEASNGQFSPEVLATVNWANYLIGQLELNLSPITKCKLLKNLAQHNLLTMYTPEAATFNDVPTNHDCFPYVEGAVKGDVMSGNPDGLFNPDTSVNKADVSKTAVTVGNFEIASSDLPVSDVSENSWYYDYVATLFSKGFLQKESATGLFNPGKTAASYWTDVLLEQVAANKQSKPGETVVNVSVGPNSPQGAASASTGMILGEFNVSFKDENFDPTGPEKSYKIKSIEIQAVSNGVALCDLSLYPKQKDLDSNYKKAVASQFSNILTFASDPADDVYGYFTVISGLSQSYVIRADVANALKGDLALIVKGLTYHDNTSGKDIYVDKNMPISNLSFFSGTGTPASSDCYGLLNQ